MGVTWFVDVVQDGIEHVALHHHMDVLPESVELEDRVHEALEAAGRQAGEAGVAQGQGYTRPVGQVIKR